VKHALAAKLACGAAFAALAAMGGCSTSGSGGASGADGFTSTGLPCPVNDVFARKCQRCHAKPPVFGAPMPLLTGDDAHAAALSNPAKKVYEVVGTRIHAETRPMPPGAPLNPADMQILDDWIAAGAPRSAATCAPPVVDDGGTGGLPCTPDHNLAPSKPWALQDDLDDDYVCYGVDITTTTKRHVTAIGPRVQNTRVLHHLDIYEAPDSFGSEPQRCSAFGSAAWRLVFAWAPGGKSLVLPPEAGFPLSGTTHYVVQMHYSNVTHLAGETDATGVDLCTTDQLRPNDADVMAFGSDHFVIPPRSPNYDLTCRVALGGSSDLKLFAVMPHMHNNGRALTQTLQPRDGGPIDLATQPNWDINTQEWFPIDATLHPGDRVATRCAWKNASDEEIYWGDAALDEMCYAFTMYYPRITDPSWNWSLPATQSACTPTTP